MYYNFFSDPQGISNHSDNKTPDFSIGVFNHTDDPVSAITENFFS